MRVALYGGSFNPPHLCHGLAATWLACQADLDAVWLLPAGGHAFGKGLAPFALRVAMLEAATAHLAPRVRVETLEAELPVPSYTLDTVEALLERHPGLQIVLVMGTDAWRERARWKGWDELARQVEVLLLGRGAGPAPEGLAPRVWLPEVSSTEVRRRLAAGEEVRHLCAPEVLRLCREHRLYGAAGPP